MEVSISVFHGVSTVTTTSLDVALTYGKKHYDILKTIDSMRRKMPDFAAVAFEAGVYTDNYDRVQPMYTMTQEGLLHVTLKFRGPEADELHKKYSGLFVEMGQELRRRMDEEHQREIDLIREEHRWEIARLDGRKTRRLLTDALRDSGENERMHGHAYSTYTRMIHGIALGETQEQTRKRLGLKKGDNLRDYLTADELGKIEYFEGLTIQMLDNGLRYESIKLRLELMAASDQEILTLADGKRAAALPEGKKRRKRRSATGGAPEALPTGGAV